MNIVKAFFKHIRKLFPKGMFASRPSAPPEKGQDKGFAFTSLHQYAIQGKTRRLESAITFEHDPDPLDRHRKSPLHYAAKYGHYDCVRLLLNNQALTWVKDQNGNTPLHLAAKYGQFNICKLLMAQGAFINLLNKKGRSPLHYAAIKGDTELAQLLIDLGARLDDGDLYHRTPLHWAISHQHPRIARLLVDSGARIDQRDRQGHTPLSLCKDKALKKDLKKRHKTYQQNHFNEGVWVISTFQKAVFVPHYKQYKQRYVQHHFSDVQVLKGAAKTQPCR